MSREPSARERALRWVRANPGNALLGAAVVAVSAYVIGYPFLVVKYPPITDLPFHAASTSILRHYWDPSFGFHKQFTLHLLEVPYVSMYAIGALLALVMPIDMAVKASAVVMLALLPAGLAVLFHGMKKTPLWGILGLGLVWTNLTHWGFLNFMGAVGLYAMSVGFALMVVDRPTRGRQWGLALSLLAVFFTHIYRFPFAVLSVAGAAVLMYPATRRIKSILLPLLPSLAVFGVWRLVRQDNMAMDAKLGLFPERLKEIRDHVIAGFQGPVGAHEQQLFDQAQNAFWVVALVALIWFVAFGRWRHLESRKLWWGIGVTLLPLILAGGFVLTYLMLPMRIGPWWYVYPREATTALFIGLAVVPDMPRAWWLRLPLVALVAVAVSRIGFLVAEQYYDFNKATADFQRIEKLVPKDAKLMYLVFDHDGSSRRTTPFIHLPAWIQAEKGGALSFHFVGWNHSPIRYRKDDPNVPPPVPDRWEWTPYRFQVLKHGKWFDEFLIRQHSNPSARLAADPSIHLVAHEGSWWLYRRVQAPSLNQFREEDSR
ncbi:MAG: hypothetical protein H6717_21975 [Polyangiaceae bacterium]|nr:hypothetical protein [Polyangiaceae bacterium]